MALSRPKPHRLNVKVGRLMTAVDELCISPEIRRKVANADIYTISPISKAIILNVGKSRKQIGQ
jgi:hypothetical protein